MQDILGPLFYSVIQSAYFSDNNVIHVIRAYKAVKQHQLKNGLSVNNKCRLINYAIRRCAPFGAAFQTGDDTMETKGK